MTKKEYIYDITTKNKINSDKKSKITITKTATS